MTSENKADTSPRTADRINRDASGLLIIDGSRDMNRPLEGMKAYIPSVNPMQLEVAEERTEIFVPWNEEPLVADPGDLIMTSEDGERHPLKKDLFDKTYTYLDDGRATKTAPTMAKQMDELFIVDTLEGQASGAAGDWLAQGADGECWPIPDEAFRKRYQI